MPPADAPPEPFRSVGTDVVDLSEPRCPGKASDTRFLERVLTAAERATLAAAPRDGATGDTVPPGETGVSPADLVLWRIWALKEAAFKAITGVLGTPPVFEHRAFEVRFGADPRGAPVEAVVRWHDHGVRGRIVPTGESGPVHAVTCVERDGRTDLSRRRGAGAAAGWIPEDVRWGRAPLTDDATVPADRFTERESRSVHSAASGRVRLHARRELAEWAGVAEGELEIVCDEGPAGRMPPRVLFRGEPAPWSVGLSHHGRWVAWVFARTGMQKAGRARR